MECGVEKIWDDWKTVRLLGEGSFGKVYEIVREQFGLQERSAVKIISIPSSPSEVQSLKSDGMTEANITEYYEGIVTEFVQEIMMMSKLRGHTNIVGYEDYKVVKRTDSFGWDIYIRMELLTSLTAYMEAMQGADPDATVSVNGREANVFGETDVIKMAVDICSALEVCYARHIVHRDIKPDNIFVSADGNFKLGDFGVAKTVEKTVSGLSKKGTPTYMAPEIYKGEPGGMNSDIYSLGIVMYKLLNDNREPFLPPFPETVRYEHKQQALARRMNGESVPRTKQGSDMLWEIVERACESDAKKRWQNPTALKNALLSVRKSGDVKRTAPKPVPPKPVTPPPPKPDPDATVAVKKAEETKTTAVKRPSPVATDIKRSPAHTPSVSTNKATTKKKMSRGKKVVIALIVWLTVALAIAIVSAVWLRPMMEGSQEPTTEQTTEQIKKPDANRDTIQVPTSVAVGDVVTFGTYEQDGDTANGAEDIEWIVLDKQDGKALVVSKYALDAKPYNEDYASVTWEICTLRTWLNDDFINAAFSETEQADIVNTTVVNDDNADDGTDGGNNTTDKIFLLSSDEAETYFADDVARECQPTAYAKNQGAYEKSDNGNCWWWLRSPGLTQCYAAYVLSDGDVHERGYYGDTDGNAVRPALWINLES